MPIDWIAWILAGLVGNASTDAAKSVIEALKKKFGKKKIDRQDLDKAFALVTQSALENLGALKKYPVNKDWFKKSLRYGAIFNNYWNSVRRGEKVQQKDFSKWVRHAFLDHGEISRGFLEINLSPPKLAEDLIACLDQALKENFFELWATTNIEIMQKQLHGNGHPASTPTGPDLEGGREESAEKPILLKMGKKKDPLLAKKAGAQIEGLLCRPDWEPILPYLQERLNLTKTRKSLIKDLVKALMAGGFYDKALVIGLALHDGYLELKGRRLRDRVVNLFGEGVSILGWLGSLDIPWKPEERAKFREKSSRCNLLIPISTSAGVAVVLGWQLEEHAQWAPGGELGVQAAFGLHDDPLIEKGFEEKDPIQYMKESFCRIMNIPWRNDQSLNEAFRSLAIMGERYHLGVNLSQADHPLSDVSTRREFEKDLPNLEIIYFGLKSENETPHQLLFSISEDEMWVQLNTYFKIREKVLAKL